jgi:Asp-tRNA(Asn)/Glu-tRNA(Gln) amidotransferase A subunit family amidase
MQSIPRFGPQLNLVSYSAKDAFQALYELRHLQSVVSQKLKDFAALVVPTIPTIFTIKEMLAEPLKRNTIMGIHTYFVNPLDLCAVSVPAARAMTDCRQPFASSALLEKIGHCARWLTALSARI